MITIPINSKLLAKIEYDQARQELHATFHSGKLYAYGNFTMADWTALSQAKSVGGHFLTNVKPKFPCYPLGTTEGGQRA